MQFLHFDKLKGAKLYKTVKNPPCKFRHPRVTMMSDSICATGGRRETVVRALTGSTVKIRMPTAWANTFLSAAQAVFEFHHDRNSKNLRADAQLAAGKFIASQYRSRA